MFVRILGQSLAWPRTSFKSGLENACFSQKKSLIPWPCIRHPKNEENAAKHVREGFSDDDEKIVLERYRRMLPIVR